MSCYSNKKLSGRTRRKIRVRKKIYGTSKKPRLNVFRSARHIYAQVINDTDGITLASTSTMANELSDQLSGSKTERAKKVGVRLAEKCKEKGITQVVFDRNGFRYHGRVRAIAESARESGLTI